MMKRTALIFAASLVVFGLAGCNKNNPDDLAAKIVGQWELVGAEFPTKSVTVGDEVLTVYVDFQARGVFTLYQQLGEGRFEVFDGSWSLAGDLLSGRYSDNSAWASDYQVSVDGDVLTMTVSPDGTDVYRYQRCTIPLSSVVAADCNLLLALHALRQLSCSRLYVSADLQIC